MQLFYDLLPILVFFIAFKIAGVYVATAAAMIVSLLQVGLYWFYHRKFEKMQTITLVLIIVLGSATLLLHNPIFIKWKPTAINWAFGLVFLGSHFIGKKPLIRHVMEMKIQLPDLIWTRLNLSWATFFFVMGVVNLYVIYHFSTNTWVNFKLFGMFGLTLVFVILQALYLGKYLEKDKLES